MLYRCWPIITVHCDATQQLARLQQRGGAGDGTAAPLSAEAAAAQIESQMPLAIKCERSDHIIDNSGSRDSLAET